MKILYVFFHSYNDMPYHVREWVEAAIGLGNKVTVLTSIDSEFLKQIGWRNKIKVIQVKYPGHGILNYLKLLKNFRAAINYEIEKNPPDMVYERFSTITPAATKICLKKHIPIAVEVNGILEEELKLSKAPLYYRIAVNRIQANVYPTANYIFPVTHQITEWIMNRYNLHEDKIMTISNGVNPNRFKYKGKTEARTKYKLPKNAFIVGYLGSIFSWSGVDLLLDAAEKLVNDYPKMFFLMGGGNDDTVSAMKKEINERRISENVLMAGKIPWDDAASFISTFDIATVPANFSKLTSGISPQKLYSYMACECPVIGSLIPGLGDVLEKTNSGICFDRKQAGSFEEAILKFYNLSEKKREEMGKAGREYILQNHTWEIAVKKGIQKVTGNI